MDVVLAWVTHVLWKVHATISRATDELSDELIQVSEQIADSC